MIATGHISNIICVTELQSSQKQPVHNLKGFTGLFLLDLYLLLYYFKTISRCKFPIINLMKQAFEFICKCHHTNHGYSNKTLITFSTYQHCPKPFAIKQRPKSVDLSPKSFFCVCVHRKIISFRRLAMSAPWISRSSLRKHGYPITGSSFSQSFNSGVHPWLTQSFK